MSKRKDNLLGTGGMKPRTYRIRLPQRRGFEPLGYQHNIREINMAKETEAIIGRGREEFNKANARLAQVFNEIEDNQKMSPWAKKQERQHVYHQAQAVSSKIKENVRGEIEALGLELEKQTFGGGDNDERYFAKVDEVANLAGKSLQDRYRKAERYGDKPTMRACAARAVETGHEQIIKSYAEENPAFKANVTNYAGYLEHTKRKGANLLISMQLGGVRKPSFYDGEWHTEGKPGGPVQHFDTSEAPVYQHQSAQSAAQQEAPRGDGVN